MEKFEEKFLVARRRDLGEKQLQLECVINLNGESLEKVLSLNAEAYLANVDVVDGEIRYSGEICTNLLYLGDEAKLNNLTSSCPFNDVYRVDNVTSVDVCNNIKVISVVPTKVQENQVVVLVTLETHFFELSNQEVSSFNPTAPEFCVESELLDVMVLKDKSCQNFEVETRFNMKEGVGKVLVSHSKAFVREVKTGEGFVSVMGDVCTFIVYTTEEGTLCKGQVSESFKEEIQVADSKSEMLAQACLQVKNCDNKIVVENENGNNYILITTPIQVCVKVFDMEQVVVSKDIYSLKNELELIRGGFTNCFVDPSKCFEGKIEGNLSLEETQPRIDKVLCVTPPTLNVSNSYFNEGEVFVEGIVTSTVIYLNDDENQITSVDLEVPFVVSEKLNMEEQNVFVNVNCMLYDCDVMAKRGREIYFDCKIKVCVNVCYNKNFEIITGATEGRALAQKDSAIEIYFAHASSSHWDIAKELKISQEMLLSQNPNLPNPLEKDERVVVYYGIESI